MKAKEMKTFYYIIILAAFSGIMATWGAMDASHLYRNGSIIVNHALSAVIKGWLIFWALFAINKIYRRNTWRETWPDALILIGVAWLVFDLAFNIKHPDLNFWYVGITAWTDKPFWLLSDNPVSVFLIQLTLKLGVLLIGILEK